MHGQPCDNMLLMSAMLDQFEQHRKELFGLAYRMHGTCQDAEDTLQDAWLRWSVLSVAPQNPRAYLYRIVTNICLDKLKSAQHQRETYIGQWLPEPIQTDVAQSPEEWTQMRESLSVAFMVLLQSLSHAERAAFLLHDVFDLDYVEVAGVLDASEPACRKWVQRAREAIQQRKPRYEPDARLVQEAVMTFMRACANGDLSAAMSALQPNAVAISDGGGKVRGVSMHTISGAEHVARLFIGLMRTAPPSFAWAFAEINAQPALVLRSDGVVFDVIAFELRDGRLQSIYSMLNPDKLRGVK